MSQPIRDQGGNVCSGINKKKKHKLGGGRKVLASCKVSSNSIQQLQWRSGKCDVEILLPVKFHQNQFSGCEEEL